MDSMEYWQWISIESIEKNKCHGFYGKFNCMESIESFKRTLWNFLLDSIECHWILWNATGFYGMHRKYRKFSNFPRMPLDSMESHWIASLQVLNLSPGVEVIQGRMVART